MRPGMASDCMALCGNFFDKIWIFGRHFTEHKERCFGAVCRQRREDWTRVFRYWTVIEGQYDLSGSKKCRITARCAEPRTAVGVDFYDTGDTKCTRRASRLRRGSMG